MRIPAWVHIFISCFTDSRGGSARPTNPFKVSSHLVISAGMSDLSFSFADATAITRSPCALIV